MVFKSVSFFLYLAISFMRPRVERALASPISLRTGFHGATLSKVSHAQQLLSWNINGVPQSNLLTRVDCRTLARRKQPLCVPVWKRAISRKNVLKHKEEEKSGNFYFFHSIKCLFFPSPSSLQRGAWTFFLSFSSVLFSPTDGLRSASCSQRLFRPFFFSLNMATSSKTLTFDGVLPVPNIYSLEKRFSVFFPVDFLYLF